MAMFKKSQEKSDQVLDGQQKILQSFSEIKAAQLQLQANQEKEKKEIEILKANPFQDISRTFTPRSLLRTFKIRPPPTPKEIREYEGECHGNYMDKYEKMPKRNPSGCDLFTKGQDEELCRSAWERVNRRRGSIEQFARNSVHSPLSTPLYSSHGHGHSHSHGHSHRNTSASTSTSTTSDTD